MSKGLAIIYDRASSKKQEENYTRQDVKRIGLEIAKQYDYDTEPEPRVEIKSGEELKNRPVMLAILDDIESGRLIHGRPIKAIIVPNFTRLSRDEDVIDGMIIRKACRDNSVVVIDFNRKGMISKKTTIRILPSSSSGSQPVTSDRCSRTPSEARKKRPCEGNSMAVVLAT